MDPQTVNLLLQLVSIASKLAPTIIAQVEAIKAQTGKTADEVFADAGVVIDQNEAKGLKILADLLTADTVASSNTQPLEPPAESAKTIFNLDI